MLSATLDSNIYVSALQFGGAGARILEFAHHGLIRIDVSDEIVDETLGVLRDKFSRDGYRIQDARQRILRIAKRVVPSVRLSVVESDHDDDRILECAVEAESQFIVTQDKDMLHLGKFEEIEILTAGDFLKRLL